MDCRMDEIDTLLCRIAAHCKRHGISRAAFGKLVLNDTSFVTDLEAGRSPTVKTLRRVKEFLRGNK